MIAYADKVVYYDDRKMGVFEPHRLDGAKTAAGRMRLDVVDYNNDGYLDMALTSPRDAARLDPDSRKPRRRVASRRNVG